MFKTITAKLIFSFVSALVLVGIAVAFLIHFSTQAFHQETNQQLHRPLAQYIIDHSQPLLNAGELNQAAIKKLFGSLMQIGPSYELYVLDKDGRVITFSADPGVIKRQYVDTSPIQQFLSGADQSHILGDDPRSATGQKIFSVAPIVNAGNFEGYLYIIIGSQLYDSIAEAIGGSQIINNAIWLVPVILLIGLFTALALSQSITRPLQRLGKTMEEFKSNSFSKLPKKQPSTAVAEIDQLANDFHDLANKIFDQVTELKNTDYLRRQLIAQVSHDLRTPLANIKGYLETWQLKHKELPEAECRKFIETALRHGHELEVLIHELFELARLEGGDITLEKEPFSVLELTSDVVQKMQHQADQKSVKLACNFQPNVPMVHGDIARLERVLTNLLDNGIKYTPPGGHVEVIINQDITNDNIKINVKDTGPGIHDHDIPYIFDPYYRSKHPHIMQSEGTGLGLAISKKIVELHDSRMHVNSKVGEGSEFYFTLEQHEKPTVKTLQ